VIPATPTEVSARSSSSRAGCAASAHASHRRPDSREDRARVIDATVRAPHRRCHVCPCGQRQLLERAHSARPLHRRRQVADWRCSSSALDSPGGTRCRPSPTCWRVARSTGSRATVAARVARARRHYTTARRYAGSMRRERIDDVDVEWTAVAIERRTVKDPHDGHGGSSISSDRMPSKITSASTASTAASSEDHEAPSAGQRSARGARDRGRAVRERLAMIRS